MCGFSICDDDQEKVLTEHWRFANQTSLNVRRILGVLKMQAQAITSTVGIIAVVVGIIISLLPAGGLVMA